MNKKLFSLSCLLSNFGMLMLIILILMIIIEMVYPTNLFESPLFKLGMGGFAAICFVSIIMIFLGIFAKEDG
jgi:hypothetical protein